MMKPHHEDLSVAGVLGGLTPDAIQGIKDVQVRRDVDRVVAFVTGVVEAHVRPDQELLTALDKAEITLDDARGLVDDAIHMLQEVAERDAAAIHYHAAVAAVQDTDIEIAGVLSHFDINLRAKLGPRSDRLKKFGFKPAIPGGRRAATRKPKPPPAP
jgi:hypothetical protein